MWRWMEKWWPVEIPPYPKQQRHSKLWWTEERSKSLLCWAYHEPKLGMVTLLQQEVKHNMEESKNLLRNINRWFLSPLNLHPKDNLMMLKKHLKSSSQQWRSCLVWLCQIAINHLRLRLDTNASGLRFGVIIMQKGRPLAFISQAFSEKSRVKSIYKREFIPVVFVLVKWKIILVRKPFS